MPKHIQDILIAAGIPAEDAERIDSLPEADQATFDSKPYMDKVKESYKTQFQNDPEFFTDLTLEKLPPAVKKKVEVLDLSDAELLTLPGFKSIPIASVPVKKVGKKLHNEILGMITDDLKEATQNTFNALLSEQNKTQ